MGKVTKGAKLLFIHLIADMQGKGYLSQTNQELARLHEIHRNTASRWINELVRQGYLQKEIIYHENTEGVQQRRLYPTQKSVELLPKGMIGFSFSVDTYQPQEVELETETLKAPNNSVDTPKQNGLGVSTEKMIERPEWVM